MAIKWKKRNISIVIVYAAAVSLLLTGAMGFLRRNTSSTGFVSSAKMLRVSDFQETDDFKEFISSRFFNFLSMACGDYVEGSGYYGYAFDIGEENVYETVNEAVLSEGDYAADWEEEVQNEITESDKQKSADVFHKHIESDQNLLYCITYQGKKKYSNMGDIFWKYDTKGNNLPTGYNFLLHFDGTKVTIKKDGSEADVYGDGIYREEGWRLPGYKNFSVKEKWEDADILILAAKEPVIYPDTNDGYWSGNDFYYMYQEYNEERSRLQKSIACIFFGLILWGCYFFLRKEKKEAGKKFAKLTEKMWFEWKVLLFFIFPLIMTVSLLNRNSVYGNFGDYSAELSYAYLSSEEYASEMTGYFIESISEQTGWILLVFWLIHIFVSDLVHNKGSYKKGCLGKLAAVLESRDFTLPLSRRIVRRSYGIVFLTFAQGCFFVVLLVVALYRGFRTGTDAGWIFVSLAFSIALFIAEYIYQRKNRQFAVDLEKLSKQISMIRSGEYTLSDCPERACHTGAPGGACHTGMPEGYTENTAISVQDEDIRHMAEELDDIRKGFETAVEERTGSERMKVELVANVSHDIKTPLTSIISYIQILKQEEDLPEYIRDYIRILDEKSERLRNMVQDVFAVSKAASGQLDVELKELDLGRLIEQTLADMEEIIQNSPVAIKTDIPKEALLVQADGGRMYRVFQNLIGNALKYSLEGSRVYITLKKEGDYAAASIRNTSSQELNQQTDFAGRFVRGDESRTDGGSGLGLSIAKSFTEACGGTFAIETIADLFAVTVAFRVLK